MDPRYDLSVEFLERWMPGGPWVLSAVTLDKKQMETRTLRDRTLVKAWLQKHGGDRNIYFSVNSCRCDMQKKLSREDIKSLDWLHVDIDPRAGEDLQAERDRALKLLQNPPAGIPKPTVIIFSGGGYQGFWKLAEPKEINGEEALFEDAKRYNQALELAFGADNCHNVDRIMRLPGTINRPDERKQKKGRTPVLAELVEWDDSRIYSLSQFTQAPAVQLETKGFAHAGAAQVQISGNIPRINNVNDLQGISDLCKMVISQGGDPDDPTRFPSRSEALWFVCCEMVRADLDNDTIYSVITDPDFAISSSVLDKGRSADKYARKQINDAREAAIDPNLRSMNSKYAVVTFGGKLRVIYEDYDEVLERHRIVKMSFEDLRNKHMHQRVQIGTDAQNNPRYAPLGDWWLRHEKRRQFERVVFAPGRETSDTYNMWRGFAMEPCPGDGHKLLLDHIYENICGASDESFQYVLGWMARAVQYPDQPGYAAVVLRGGQGVGKGFLARTFGKLFGRHFIHVSNVDHLVGNFNAHLWDCVVLFADEAFYAGDKRHAGTLKTLVTEPSLMITPKGVDTETTANCLHIIMASNEEWVVPAGFKERRFCVLDVADKHMQDTAYFGKISQAMRSGGYASLLHYLLSYDLSAYNVANLPQTVALREQKIHSFDPMHEWWYDKLVHGKLLVEHEGWLKNALTEEIIADFVEYMRQWGVNTRRGSSTKLGQFLKNATPGMTRWQSRDAAGFNGKVIQRPYYYTFPTLADCRAHWDAKFGGPFDWPPVSTEKPEEPPIKEPF